MTRLPSVLGTDDLSIAELCAARIDGDLFALADAWAPIDEPDLPALRALAVAHGARRDLIVERMSAAWVHGACVSLPRRAQFCVPADARISIISDPGIVVREVRLSDDEVTLIGGVRCTTVVRTAFDLLRDPTTDDLEAIDAVAMLLTEHPALEAEVRERLDTTTRVPFTARASSRLDRASDARRRGVSGFSRR
ncbi:hypothetical protein [Agromyces sp. NPDC058110]|uniref:hypothetical protein n=1 Tax=Agromyces sp. NPDC058110 TaxID=3346345 RepID=UPI0036D7C1E9